MGKDSSSSAAASKSEKGRACSAPNRRGHAKGYDAHNRDTFGGGGDGGEDQANGDDVGGGGGGGGGGGVGEGWDFESMLAANERLTGRKFEYDGNPHEFGDPVQAKAALVPPTGCAATGAGASTSASASAGGGCAGEGATPARSHGQAARKEDQVGHLKQRGGGGGHRSQAGGATSGGGFGNNGKPAKAAAGGVGAVGSVGGGGRKGSREVVRGAGGTGGRSRSRGKGAAAKAKASASATSAIAATAACEGRMEAEAASANAAGLATTMTAANVRAEGKTCPQAASSPCTEGAADGARGVAWGSGPVGATSAAAGGAGLFGEFKFDMLDIMSAVPQG